MTSETTQEKKTSSRFNLFVTHKCRLETISACLYIWFMLENTCRVGWCGVIIVIKLTTTTDGWYDGEGSWVDNDIRPIGHAHLKNHAVSVCATTAGSLTHNQFVYRLNTQHNNQCNILVDEESLYYYKVFFLNRNKVLY